MQKTKSGFTIVELLIVIVVIAVLATISIVAYTGIQVRTENTKTMTAVSEFVKILRSYKAVNGNYPSHSGTYTCLGARYVDDMCGTATDGSTPNIFSSASLNQALQATATLPQPSTKMLTLSTGAKTAGASFEYNSKMIRYHLEGANQPCTVSDATGLYTYGSVTQCRIILE